MKIRREKHQKHIYIYIYKEAFKRKKDAEEGNGRLREQKGYLRKAERKWAMEREREVD